MNNESLNLHVMWGGFCFIAAVLYGFYLQDKRRQRKEKKKQ